LKFLHRFIQRQVDAQHLMGDAIFEADLREAKGPGLQHAAVWPPSLPIPDAMALQPVPEASPAAQFAARFPVEFWDQALLFFSDITAMD
jgi:hypothetical protein